ncbi:hypothetical protein SDC9_175103 [bioreactor metagenome]|uniref:Uncharacterized protein n=1 Tax=bioreactor metagenome TaxID=1076179 RepID=A0A645GP43_9ZZZZ
MKAVRRLYINLNVFLINQHFLFFIQNGNLAILNILFRVFFINLGNGRDLFAGLKLHQADALGITADSGDVIALQLNDHTLVIDHHDLAVPADDAEADQLAGFLGNLIGLNALAAAFLRTVLITGGQLAIAVV